MTITHVYVDLDGVLADFFGGVCDLFGKMVDPPDHFHGLAAAFGVPENELWEKIDRAGSRFWSELEPYPWNEELLGIAQRIAGEGVYIATSPSWQGCSAAGKMTWMTQQFAVPGRPFRDFVIGTHKHLLAHSQAMLIDDSPEKLTSWTEAGGVGILWPQPWNVFSDANEARVDCLSRLRERL